MPRFRSRRAPIRTYIITTTLITLVINPFLGGSRAFVAPLRGAALRAQTYKTDPCLARIVDRENRRWEPTLSFGGGHNVNASYGLPQANPGTKMRSAGADWRTNGRTQLRWAVTYANGRYGSTCKAWAAWQRQGGWW